VREFFSPIAWVEGKPDQRSDRGIFACIQPVEQMIGVAESPARLQKVATPGDRHRLNIFTMVGDGERKLLYEGRVIR
jgi:hypothetical protein